MTASTTRCAGGPESAANVRIVLEMLRGDDAPLLYRQLWGYSPEQLETGAAEQLVGCLEDEELAVRVLSFENLRRITGSTHNYRPEFTAMVRRTSMRLWREQLREGSIVYKTPPMRLPEREPLGETAPPSSF